jgi:hypothetical protein
MITRIRVWRQTLRFGQRNLNTCRSMRDPYCSASDNEIAPNERALPQAPRLVVVSFMTAPSSFG